MDTYKRTLEQTSPDIASANTPKKITINKKHTTSPAMADCFSWAIFDQKLNSALDDKLKGLVRKEDLAPITTEIQELRCENTRLQNDLQVMKTRLEAVDKASRRNNVVLSGINAKNVAEALSEFKDICNITLKINVSVVDVRMISNGKSFLFFLGSPMEVNAVIAQRRFLAGSKIYMDKDYTAEERSERYFLRQIGRNAKIANNLVKVRHGDHRVYINDKPFSWARGKIIAANNADAEFLRGLLSNSSFDCIIDVKSQTTNTSTSSNRVNLD